MPSSFSLEFLWSISKATFFLDGEFLSKGGFSRILEATVGAAYVDDLALSFGYVDLTLKAY